MGLIERYHAETGEPCPVTYVSKRLGLHHETVRECVSTLFERGLVLGPGSPVTPAAPLVIPSQRYQYIVYFLLDAKNSLVKIGRTNDMERRLHELKKSSAGLVMLIGTVDGLSEMRERDWHLRFKQSRVTGEWFALTPDLRAELGARFGVQLTPPPQAS